jgi:hypothetical protein
MRHAVRRLVRPFGGRDGRSRFAIEELASNATGTAVHAERVSFHPFILLLLLQRKSARARSRERKKKKRNRAFTSCPSSSSSSCGRLFKSAVEEGAEKKKRIEDQTQTVALSLCSKSLTPKSKRLTLGT